MQLDRRISDYLEKRAVLMKAVGDVCLFQMIIAAVFFTLKMVYIMSCNDGCLPDYLTIIHVAIIVFLSGSVCLVGSIVVGQARDIERIVPDSKTVVASRQILGEAYDFAKRVLNIKALRCLLAGLIGVFIMLCSRIAIRNSDIGLLIGQGVMCVVLGIVLAIAIPVIDRIRIYRLMLYDNNYGLKRSRSFYVGAMIGAILTPVAVALWFILKYYLGVTDYPWVTFVIEAIVLGVSMVLTGPLSTGR